MIDLREILNLCKLGHFDKARNKIENQQPTTYQERALLLGYSAIVYSKENDKLRAIKLLRKSIEIDKENAALMVWMVENLSSAGFYEEALEYAKKISTIDNEGKFTTLVALYQAFCQFHLGSINTAKAYFIKAGEWPNVAPIVGLGLTVKELGDLILETG